MAAKENNINDVTEVSLVWSPPVFTILVAFTKCVVKNEKDLVSFIM